MLRLSLLGLGPLLLLISGCARQVVAQSSNRPRVLPQIPSFPRQAFLPPTELPQVDVFGDGTLRTDGVNRITARARVGSVEWLGTVQGLKRVDTATKAVRYVTRRDGLPGDYIEAVVADASGVYAVVRDARKPDHVFLGTLNPKTLRWKPLAEHTARGDYALALSPSAVVLAPPGVTWQEDTFLKVVDRTSQKVRGVPWDESLRADFEAVVVRFALIRENTVWLGTEVGLLSVPLTGAPRWSRALPDQELEAGVWTPSGTLWLVTHARMPPNPNFWENQNRTLQPLFLREWSPATQALVQEAPLPLTFPKNTYPSPALYRSFVAWSNTGPWVSRPEEGLLHYDPTTKQWERGPDIARTAPEAAQVPLALTRIDPYPQTVRYPSVSAIASPDDWVTKCFPSWLTRSTSAAVAESRTVPMEQSARFGRLIDPENSEIVWASEGNSLLRVPREKVPAIQRGGDGRSFGTAGFSRVEAERFPASVGSRKVPLPLGTLLTQGDGELAALTGQGLFVTQGKRWEKIKTDRNGDALDYSNNSAVVAGKQGHVFVRRAQGLFRVDSQARQLRPLALTGTERYSLKAGLAQGLLFQESHSVLFLQALDSHDQPQGALKRIELKYPSDPPTPMVFWAAVGSTLWCSGSLPGKPEVVVGYDLETGRWTTPHALTDRGVGGGNPFTVLHGELYCASESDQGALLHYDTRAARWTPLVPSVPKKTSQGLGLAALTDDEVLFADRNQGLRYDRKAHTWSELALSEAVRRNAGEPFAHQVAERNGVCYLGGEKGLWRYHPDSRHWEEVQAAVSGSDALFLHLRSVDKKSVWGEAQGQGNPAPRFTFRFDKRTHGFQFYGADVGIPTDYSYQQVADGTGYWFLTNKGSWRLDDQTGRCTQITPEALSHLIPDPYDEGMVYLLSRQGARLQRFDTRTGQLRTFAFPSLAQGSALLVERSQLVVCADSQLFAVSKTSGTWKPLRLPRETPPLAAHTIQRTKSGSLLLRDYSGQNQIEVKP